MSKNIYSSGHHESVLRLHSWRTAQNSAAYLLKYLRPDMHILDIGCGPGTITASFARLIPQGHVTGVDHVAADSEVLNQARRHAAEQGISNVTFASGDVYDLSNIPDGTYDVVHCHQVIQHVTDPIRALKEMRRVAKPGGLVAVREADMEATAWYPETAIMDEWMELYRAMADANGTVTNAGRRLVSWALAVGFERSTIEASAGTWCYSSPEERVWFGETWADRMMNSTYGTRAIEEGLADKEKLERIAEHWKEWTRKEDGWFALLHGEIVCHV